MVTLQQAVIQQALEALEAANQWDKARNFLIPYRVRDPIHAAIIALHQALEAGAGIPASQQDEPVAEVVESHVRPGLNGMCTAIIESRERLSVGAELFLHPQPAQQLEAKQAYKTTGWLAPRDQYAVPVLFNPYSGEPRDVRDVQSDPQGLLIVPPGKVEMLAATPTCKGRLQVEQNAEPVAWCFRKSLVQKLQWEKPVGGASVLQHWTPLYTHPQPAQQPLTDEQIEELFIEDVESETVFLAARARREALMYFTDGARAAIRARSNT